MKDTLMIRLGRYYTHDIFSNLLVSKFRQKSPNKIIDLSVGEGALLKAAANRWENSSYICIDIDELAVKKIQLEFPHFSVHHLDSLSNDLESRLKLTVGTIDLAICNPPFLTVKNKKQFADLFNEADLKGCNRMPIITSDLLFFAQNLKLLKEGGELGIILPDTLITRFDFRHFRESLLENHNVESIIQLPDNIFKKTEARTYILIVRKGMSSNKCIPLFKADHSGKCEQELEIKQDSLIQRMDYDYHAWQSRVAINNSRQKFIKLKYLVKGIGRGSYSQNELKKKKIDHFHTTNFSNYLFTNNIVISQDYKGYLAHKGDILLARVGKRIIGKVTIAKESIPISDCILCIRPNDNYREHIYQAINSKAGQEWFKAKARGVCARVISKKDLLEFPVPIP